MILVRKKLNELHNDHGTFLPFLPARAGRGPACRLVRPGGARLHPRHEAWFRCRSPATIDGLTRYNARHNPALSRLCGVLFSLGHGAVVVCIALAVSTVAGTWAVPEWLDALGAWVSIVFLAGLGIINLRAVLFQGPPRRSGAAGRFQGAPVLALQRTTQPLLVAAVGALFAFSSIP